MKQSPAEPGQDPLDEASIRTAARRLLDRSTLTLECELGPRLAELRHAALARAGRGGAARQALRPGLLHRFAATMAALAWAPPVLPGAVFAATAVAFLAVNVWLLTPAADLPANATALEVELLEDLEFYAWLEWQQWQPVSAAPTS